MKPLAFIFRWFSLGRDRPPGNPQPAQKPATVEPGPRLDVIAPGIRYLAVPIAEISPVPIETALKYGAANLSDTFQQMGLYGQEFPVVYDVQTGQVIAGEDILYVAQQLAKSWDWTHVALLPADKQGEPISAT